MPSVYLRRRVGVVVLAGFMAGCSTLPRDSGTRQVRGLASDRLGADLVLQPTSPDTDAQISQWLQEPLTAERAVRIGLVRNPRVQVELARLGISRADVLEASRISNPTFAASSLRGDHSSESSIGLSQSLADLILLPSRKRLAAGEFERAQREAAAALVGLAADIEAAWYRYAAASQVAQMRAAVRDAAAASAELAQRFHDAGNLTPLELALEQGAAASARLQASSAAAELSRARLALARQIGTAGERALPDPAALSAPVPQEDALEALLTRSREQRLDILAARQEVAVREKAATDARAFRWLGSFDVGVERNRTEEGRHLTGPTLSIGVPVFNQNQGPIARAQALRDEAKAQLDQLEQFADNDVRAAVAGVDATREAVSIYRDALLPLREAVVKRTQENVNYMLVGVFELLLTKQQQFDAYQAYVDAVRDYWLARVDAQRAVGGRLPSDNAVVEPALDIDAILNPPPASAHGHHGMGHDMSGMKHDMSGMKHDAPAAQEHGPGESTQMQHEHEQGKEHDMGHDMPGMKHDMSGMKHDAPATKEQAPGKPKQTPSAPPGDMSGMQHDMPGMKHDMSGMKHDEPATQEQTPGKSKRTQSDVEQHQEDERAGAKGDEPKQSSNEDPHDQSADDESGEQP